MAKSSNVRVKKVNPYPIDVSLGSVQGKIVRLERRGFLVETVQPLKVNEVISSQFSLPVVNHLISFTGVVIKTYDRFQGQLGENSANLKLAEVNFRKIDQITIERIAQFLHRIGQKG